MINQAHSKGDEDEDEALMGQVLHRIRPLALSAITLPFVFAFCAISVAFVPLKAKPEIGSRIKQAPPKKSKRPRRPLPPMGKSSSPPTTWIVDGEFPDAGFAELLACPGDVNGDGYSDVFISQSRAPKGEPRLLGFFGSTNGLSQKASWVGFSEPDDEFTTEDVKPIWAGDVNGDGCDDLLVLAERIDRKTLRHVPSLQLFLGSTNGLPATPAWAVTTNEIGVDELLTAMGIGDINGDGFDDFGLTVWKKGAVSDRGYQVFIFYGSPNGPKKIPDAVFDLDENRTTVGPSLARAGDVNGDGFDDLLIGAPKWSGTAKSRGRALIFYGSPNGLETKPSWTATYDLPIEEGVDDENELHFGWSVASAGDVNRDGFSDVIIGAPYADHGDINEGLAFLYCGSRNGLSRKHDWFVESNHPYALLGFRVSGVGDVNGDGYDDVAIGVPSASDGQFNEGAVLVYYGSKDGLSKKRVWSKESDNSGQMMGMDVAAGDVNGDGYADVLVTGREFLRDGVKLGRVYVFYGSATGLSGSANWSLQKPLLDSFRQQLSRISPVWKWSTACVFCVLLIGSVIGWTREARKRRILEAAEIRAEERLKVVRDAHDHLGSTLSQIMLQSELAKSKPENGLPVGQHIEAIAQSAQSALTELKELVWVWRPGNDSLEGFAIYLAENTQLVLSPAGIRVELDLPREISSDIKLDSEVLSNLAAMLKEILRNMVRHSGATEAKVTLRYDKAWLHLKIRDNGRGFVTTDILAGSFSGNGLKNLRERARMIGGKIAIDSELDSGTGVKINAPLKA